MAPRGSFRYPGARIPKEANSMRSNPPSLVVLGFLVAFLAAGPVLSGDAGPPPEAPKPSPREEALRALCGKLGIGEGAFVADIGCGNGGDSFAFAGVVGPRGTVFAEEIGEKAVKGVLDGAKTRKLRQVVPVLGETDDPHLPDGSLDLIYSHYVYHHLANPLSMLRNMWLDLRPGGRLVIVDMGGGVTRGWIPVAEREGKHNTLGETTVVRQVREAGFLFADLGDDVWKERKDYILIFEKPRGHAELPAGDPDLPSPLDGRKLAGAIAAPGVRPQGRPPCALVAALDRGRDVLPAVAGAMGQGGRIFDLVPEEWATSKDEVPPAPEGTKVEAVRSNRGRFAVPEGASFDLVVFADAYHRLWDPTPVLADVHGTLAPGAPVVIIDRKGPADESRRVAGHRRRISPDLVRKEMAGLGFDFVRECEAPAPDRFVLVFRARPREKWVSAPRRGETFGG
jgi:SAM-dependent methyltransferase